MIAEPVLVPTNSGTSPGFLVYVNNSLLCIVVRIDEQGAADQGRWKINLGMGPWSGDAPRPVEYLDEVIRWLAGRCAGSRLCEDKIQAVAVQMEEATVMLTSCAAR